MIDLKPGPETDALVSHFIENHPHAASWHKEDIDALRDLLNRAIEAAEEECIKWSCNLCWSGHTPERRSDGEWWHVYKARFDVVQKCGADSLRHELYRRRQRREGK